VRRTKHTNKPKTAATMVWLDQNAPKKHVKKKTRSKYTNKTCATMVWMDRKCTNLTKHMNKLKTAATMGVDGSNVCTNKQANRTSNKIDYWKDRDRDLQL
jgi:hypothetical protein